MQTSFDNSLHALSQEKAFLASKLEDEYSARAKIHTDLKAASKYIGTLEERVYDSNSTSLALLK